MTEASIAWGGCMISQLEKPPVIPDPPGRGVIMDASPFAPMKGASLYFSFVAKASAIGYTELFEGGGTQNGGYHPGVDYNNFPYQFMPGAHLAYRRFTFNLTYYRFPKKVFSEDLASTMDWVNISLEYRW